MNFSTFEELKINGLKKVIIIGASSGIGASLAREMSAEGYQVGITGRRLEKLNEVAASCKNATKVQAMDVTDFETAVGQLAALVTQLGGMDIIVLNAGIGDPKPGRDSALQMIHTNATGFVNLSEWAMQYFITNGSKGHIVGVSSVAGTRGARVGNVYGATKRFISHYMDGMRHYCTKKRPGITITDIRPGFIKTPMTEENKGMFWVSSAEKAAKYISKDIKRKRNIGYISRRWRLVRILWNSVPTFIYNRL